MPPPSWQAAGRAARESSASGPSPGTSSTQPEHQRGDRCEGMAVDLAQINRPARAPARARTRRARVSPRSARPGSWATTECHGWPPTAHSSARLRPSPAVRGSIGNLPLGIDGNVEAPCPHAHGAALPEPGGAAIALSRARTIARTRMPIAVVALDLVVESQAPVSRGSGNVTGRSPPLI